MQKTTFQHPELRDANDNIIQQGAFGKNTALANSTNDGWIDYVANDLEALRDNINGSRIYVKNKDALTTPGDISAMYIAEDTGKWYLWDGTKYIETDNARKIADEAIAARDAAKASQSAAKTSETNAKTSETNAAASKTAAATSASAAKTSENNAGTQANTAKAWATSTTSPDGAADTSSTTGKTQSAKSWAMYSKDRATASASSASAAAGSASAAKTSENNAASSKSAAATSATNAANSAKAAASSATAAANSAREQQADWNVTDTTSKAFIKNKPAVYPCAKMLEIEDTRAQINTPSFFINNYNSRIKSDFKMEDSPEAETFSSFITITPWHDRTGGYPSQLAFTARGNIFYRIGSSSEEWGNWKRIPFKGETIARATADASGNVITTTYARKDNASITNLTVTGETNVPTANAGNSSKAIANTAYVQGELTNYLPLSGGTLTGDVDITGDLSVSGAITGNVTGNVTGTASGNLPLSGGTMTGTITTTANPGLKVRGDDSYLVLCGASSHQHGAHMLLNGENRLYNEGTFGIVANNGSNRPALLGKPDGTLTWDGQPLLPVGIVQAFAGTTIPNGWLLCDGSAVSRTTYANLFSVIGTTYGSGNGSTTFNLPNLVDKFVEGSATAGTVKSAGLPNITGTFQTRYPWNGAAEAATGAFKSPPTTTEATFIQAASNGKLNYNTVSFNANKSNSIYGNSTTVQPPALTMRYIIKY